VFPMMRTSLTCTCSAARHGKSVISSSLVLLCRYDDDELEYADEIRDQRHDHLPRAIYKCARTPLFLSSDSSRSDPESRSISRSRSRSRSPSSIRSLPSQPPSETEDSPPADILDAVAAPSLPFLRLQAANRLPFRLRDLRLGFVRRCLAIGVSTARSAPTQRVSIIYARGEHCEWAGHMSRWRCPICDVHGAFPNRDMLQCHLEWDHTEVAVRWEEVDRVRHLVSPCKAKTDHFL
jgi:hypothetical protein